MLTLISNVPICVLGARLLPGDLQRRDSGPARQRPQEEDRAEGTPGEGRIRAGPQSAAVPQQERLRHVDAEGLEQPLHRRDADEQGLVAVPLHLHHIPRDDHAVQEGQGPAQGRQAESGGSGRLRAAGQDR